MAYDAGEPPLLDAAALAALVMGVAYLAATEEDGALTFWWGLLALFQLGKGAYKYAYGAYAPLVVPAEFASPAFYVDAGLAGVFAAGLYWNTAGGKVAEGWLTAGLFLASFAVQLSVVIARCLDGTYAGRPQGA
eukprot:TRINITY_DN29888_c0_g1_i1.p2 TRINITY_DN29888_c0_g1~~TRINITY_DN29888_c0_g1_i1.p2  ORF type:complete len:134 (+),score=47.61 TRINITY_DN29888_c0_g1_i1:90-491(+)